MVAPEPFEEVFDFDRDPIWATEAKVQPPFRGLHIHNGMELGVVTSGEGSLNFNGILYPLYPGTIFFFDASVPHWHVSAAGKIMQMNIVVFLAVSIAAFAFEGRAMRLLEPFLAVRVGFPPVLSGHATIAGLVHDIVTLYQRREANWDLRVFPKLSQVLVEIACETRPAIEREKPQYSTKVNKIMKALYYIHIHYRESFTIETLAILCHLSTSHFSHIFKEIVGLSPLRYRDQLRVAYAIRRLLFSDDSISSISMDCGFSDEAQFRAIFKGVTGWLPSEYRKRFTSAAPFEAKTRQVRAGTADGRVGPGSG